MVIQVIEDSGLDRRVAVEALQDHPVCVSEIVSQKRCKNTKFLHHLHSDSSHVNV